MHAVRSGVLILKFTNDNIFVHVGRKANADLYIFNQEIVEDG